MEQDVLFYRDPSADRRLSGAEADPIPEPPSERQAQVSAL